MEDRNPSRGEFVAVFSDDGCGKGAASGGVACTQPVSGVDRCGQAQGIEGALIDEPLAVDAQTPLSELLSHVGQAPCAVPVIDEEQQYVGIISKRMLLQALDREGANNG